MGTYLTLKVRSPLSFPNYCLLFSAWQLNNLNNTKHAKSTKSTTQSTKELSKQTLKKGSANFGENITNREILKKT